MSDTKGNVVTTLKGYNPSNPLHSSWSRIFSRQKYEAQRGGKSWNITPEHAWEIINKQNWHCALSGVQFTPGGARNRTQMSLDRINSSIGYESGNLQYVTLVVNYMKKNLSDQDFISICKQVAGHAK